MEQNSERFLTEKEAKEYFIANADMMEIWRRDGMPYGKDKNGDYIYDIDACTKWFLGEK